MNDAFANLLVAERNVSVTQQSVPDSAREDSA
jgi:hypothetical protein